MVLRRLLNREENAPCTDEDLRDAWDLLNELKAERKPKAEQYPGYAAFEDVYHRPGCMVRGDDFLKDVRRGQYVCVGCGVVSQCPVIDGMPDRKGLVFKANTYRRVHHWNERIGQFLCQESPVPQEVMDGVREWFAAKKLPVTKTRIRQALRCMKKAKYVEKWISIQCELTGAPPPSPDAATVECLRHIFPCIEAAFRHFKPAGRKSMLNYNFLFVRVLQHYNRPQYFRYFPLLKSKNKVRVLDEVWKKIAAYLGWEYMPLPTSKQFR